MKRRRTLHFTGITLLLATPLAFCLAGGPPQQAAVRPAVEQPTIAELMNQIKQLRKRVVELENRVAELEGREAEFHADKHGVLHDDQGRPLGFWGVDADE